MILAFLFTKKNTDWISRKQNLCGALNTRTIPYHFASIRYVHILPIHLTLSLLTGFSVQCFLPFVSMNCRKYSLPPEPWYGKPLARTLETALRYSFQSAPAKSKWTATPLFSRSYATHGFQGVCIFFQPQNSENEAIIFTRVNNVSGSFRDMSNRHLLPKFWTSSLALTGTSKLTDTESLKDTASSRSFSSPIEVLSRKLFGQNLDANQKCNSSVVKIVCSSEHRCYLQTR